MNGDRFYASVSYILDQAGTIIGGVEFERVKIATDNILRAKQSFVYGVGRSGIVGKAFAMRLVQLGLKAYFIGESTTPIVERGDAVILISNTGETSSAIQTAEIVNRVGAHSIVVTSEAESSLAKLAEVLIVLNMPEKINTDFAPLGTLFEDSAMIVLDGMISEIMERKGENDESMRSRHAIWV